MNIPNTNKPRIVVIGGGFAGISFLRNLKKSQFQVVLFDKRNYHTFQPLLYQVSTAGLEPDSIAYPLRKIFRKHEDFHFRLAEVHRIDTRQSTVHTSIGDLSFDHLVIATGTRTNFFGNKSIEEHSMPMKTVPQALNIRSLMLQNIEKADITDDPEERKCLLNFVIAGAGPTGVELAGALAEFRKGILKNDYPHIAQKDMQVHLVEGSDRVLSPMSTFASAKAKKFLEKMGVRVHLNTLVASYDGTTVTTSEGKTFDAATFIWAAGVTGSPVETNNGKIEFARGNRYPVNEFNQVDGHTNLYALGDVAYMPTEQFPQGHPQVAQPAIQQGRRLASNIMRLQKGKKMLPFRYTDKGTMATIGRNKAVADIKKMRFAGLFAWILWMVVHLFFLVGFRNRVVTFFNWTYNYINYDKAARLIIRPYKRN
ncbi:NAD(P)/FAD-dependent oxidoreductase [Aureitalea sp. L0-47]|uniref:NAD(P)/FAD-dependent oxidoreductase n=1 Tax=Aureitalea sp. L0-47 TaxID=2816962 RepID=UPI002237DE0A|nr:NAD(P)/FAD-dependent oxidoreductase [Aureitalea sp. L0-47]MCW5519784.1 NAD(P)/FAD-dependent oxidoreductase [Aureitalea sp. L0-47]